MWSDRNGGATAAAITAPEPFRYRQSGQSAGNGASVAPEIDIDHGDDPARHVRELQERAFDEGRQKGESLAKASAQSEIASEREKIEKAIEKFKDERSTYFAHIETEVVHLALAIARKILHREAQMDPLLLTGMVHVALEKLDAGSHVRMRTHPTDVRSWSEFFGQQGPRSLSPELVGDASLRRGECVLETESGSTQMSLEGQLKEIEQGFLDLLEQRPRVG
jgi:flagellar assembly protein FliH